VILPDGFDFTLAGRDRRQPLADWSALGIRDAYGNPIPRLDLPASLLVPAGHDGPAYLVYENFDVILRWNRSEYYAISIGRLADRLAGGDALEDSIDASRPGVSRADVSKLQAGLTKLGYDAGTADGIIGPATRRALRQFQADRDRIADGHVDATSVAAVAKALDESMRDIHP
jgi:membrane-bound lytic murein transglycosylase B